MVDRRAVWVLSCLSHADLNFLFTKDLWESEAGKDPSLFLDGLPWEKVIKRWVLAIGATTVSMRGWF